MGGAARRLAGLLSGRALIGVWALTLLLLAGSVVYLQLSYSPPPPPETAAGTTVEAAPAAPSEKAEAEDGEPASADVGAVQEDSPEVAAQEVEEGPQDVASAAETSALIRLAPAPDPDLVESGPHGLLPVKAPDGRQPWRVYARPFLGDPVAPRVALVIVDVGLGRAATRAAIETLPPAVTLAISPYAPEPQEVARRARAAGHEVLLMVPMEPRGYPGNDPGPHALLVDRPAEEIRDDLHYVMSRFQGYVGIVNQMGSRFTTDRQAVELVVSEIAPRGLLVLDARAAPGSLLAPVAAEMGVPHAANDRFIDNTPSAQEIDRALEALAKRAAARGRAVGIGRPYPVTLARIRAWSETLAARGLELAPVSALVSTDEDKP